MGADKPRGLTMHTITIELPDTFSFESRDETFGPFDITSLSVETVARLVMHGLKQKLGDKNAKANDHHGVEKTWATLVAGEWRIRGEAKPGLGKVESKMYSILWNLVRDKYMEDNGIDKVKSLTDSHEDDITVETDRRWDDGGKDSAKLRDTAEKALAAKRKPTLDDVL